MSAQHKSVHGSASGFRSEIAAASLKQERQYHWQRLSHGFRNDFAAASLKRSGERMRNPSHYQSDTIAREAITRIGRAMGIKTIAERVETAEVLACLGDIGVEYGQGIYIAVPESVESLSRITRTHPKLRLVHSA